MSSQPENSFDTQNSNKTKSKSQISLTSSKSPKSVTSSIQLSQSNAIPRTTANIEEPKHVLYPSSTCSYHPNKSPPDFSLAARHGNAHQVAPLENLLTSTGICESTGVPLPTKKLSVLCSLKQLSHLGPVYPMYFLFIKHLGIVMLIFFMLDTIIRTTQVLENSKRIFPYQEYVTLIFQSELQQTILIMSSLCVLLSLFFIMHRFRKHQKQYKMGCKGGNLSPADYTIMSSNLGDALSDEEIKAFFTNHIVPGFSLDVVKVMKTYDIERYVAEIRKLTKLLEKKGEAQERLKNNISQKEMFNIEKIDMKIEEINHFFIRRKSFLANFQIIRKNDTCFVTFNTKREAKVVKRKFETTPVQRFFLNLYEKIWKDTSSNRHFFNQKLIKVEKAPEPREIIWENIRQPKPRPWFSLIYFAFCMIVFGLTGFGEWKIIQLYPNLSSYLVGVIVAVTNELLYFVVFGLAFWENYITLTEKHISLAYKLSMLQIINMAAPIFILNVVTSFNPSNLSYQFLWIGVGSFGLPLIIKFINPRYLMKSLRRLQAVSQGSKCSLTQDQLNQLFENPELNISALYANLLMILMFTLLCFSACPTLAIAAPGAMLISYWIDKYNLLRRSLIPSYTRSELSEAIFECLEFSFFLFALGNLILSIMVNIVSSERAGPGIMLGTSVFEVIITTVYMLLPNRRINRGWYPSENKQSNWSSNLFYQQAAEYFPSDYHLCNPIVRLGLQPQEMKEKYQKTFEKFKCIDILRDCPEILPMFEYANKYPSPFEIWKRNLEGLQNPYYIYPQNYGYGLVHLVAVTVNPQTGNKVPLLQDDHGDAGARKKAAKTINNSSCYDRSRADNEHTLEHSNQKRRDTRELVSLVGEMNNGVQNIELGMPKRSAIYSKQSPPQNQFMKTKQNGDSQRTLTLDSLKSDISVLGDDLKDCDSSIIGMSPILNGDLNKYVCDIKFKTRDNGLRKSIMNINNN